MRRARYVPILAVLLAAAACTPDRQAPPNPRPDPSAVQAFFTERAAQVAALWQGPDTKAGQGGFVPVDPLTIWPPSAAGDEMKRAAANGLLSLDIPLPVGTGQGVIAFPDGQTLQVAVVSAREAYDALNGGSGLLCSGCAELSVTGAKLTTAKLRTSRGTATVPAWAFTVRGRSEPIMRVAVVPDAIAPMPKMSDAPLPGNLPVVGAAHLMEISGDRIDYTLGVGVCDEDLRPLWWESDRLVILGGSTYRPSDACLAMGLEKPVSATLSRPVGDRVILDVVTGQPISTP